MNENKSNFLDPKTLLAIAIVAIVWISWQAYLSKKYPNQNKPLVTQETQNTEKTENKISGTTASDEIKSESEALAQKLNKDSKQNEDTISAAFSEKLIHYDLENISFDVSSKGMGIKNLHLKKFKDDANQDIILSNESPYNIGELSLISVDNPVDFVVESTGSNEISGKAEIQGMQIERKIIIDSKKYSFTNKLFIKNMPSDFTGVFVYLPDQTQKPVASSFLAPNYDIQDFYVASGAKESRYVVAEKEALNETLNQVSVLSIGTKYFGHAILDESEIIPKAKIKFDGQKELWGRLSYQPENKPSEIELSFKIFSGPKDLHLLEQNSVKFRNFIDFGMFSILAIPLLRLLKWLYEIFGNYGLAIIALTLIVRMILLPFTVLSFKSMKRMQVIQPMIKELRAKYKDDPVTMNKEMMRMMKENKANPFGGCWPMLLQLPVFFALYKVLSISVELYKAPFYWWIQDLSIKDQYYILPFLMGVAMYLQQKLTPTTMDPQQEKIFKFKPIIFTLLMISLPSGLTLYIFVSSLFSIVQQVILMRDTKTTVPAK